MTTNTQLYPILINLLAAFIGAFGQYSYKLGAAKLKTTPLYQNWEILLGMLLFCAVMVLFILAFKIGGKISVTYPVYSLTFIIGTAIGIWHGKESWSGLQLLGVFLVIIGIGLVAAFSPQN